MRTQSLSFRPPSQVAYRAIAIALSGWLVTIDLAAASDVPSSNPTTTNIPTRQMTGLDTNETTEVRTDIQDQLRLRRTAVESRRAYLAAKAAHADIQALEKRVRSLIDQVNEMYERQAVLARDNPEMSTAVVANQGSGATSVVSRVFTSGQSSNEGRGQTDIRREFADLGTRIAEKRTSINDLVDQQNAIADSDHALLALKAAMQRANNACASNEMAQARSPSSMRPDTATPPVQP